jgi:hypothetical protein
MTFGLDNVNFSNLNATIIDEFNETSTDTDG